MRRRDFSLEGFIKSFAPEAASEKPAPVRISASRERLKPSTRAVSIGVDERGGVVNLPLFENRIAIVGASGSGKSVVANEVLSGVFAIPARYRIAALIDLKGGVEISSWIPAADAYAVDAAYANRIVRNVEREMVRRQRALFNSGGKKVKISEGCPLLVLFIDELAEIADSKDELNRDTMERLRSIFRLGRATGIVPIVCLQRPDSKLLSGDLKNNISTTICGKLRSEVDTKTVFGDVNTFPAHALSGHWFYFVGDKNSAKFKTPYKENERGMTDEWEAVIAAAAADKPPERGKFLYFDEDRAQPDSSQENAKSSEPPKSAPASAKKKPGRKSKRGRPKKSSPPPSSSGFGFE